MTERLRVMLLLSSLHGGGAERVAVHLMNRSDSAQFDVRMGLLRRAGPFLDAVDPERVDASPIAQKWLSVEGLNSSFYRPHKLLPAIALAPINIARMIAAHRPHVVMSFTKGMSLLTWTVLPGLGPNRPRWIAREGNNTDAVIDDELTSPAARAVVRHLVRRCYRSADCFLANSHEMATGLEKRLGLDHSRMRVIQNPVDIGDIQRLARAPIPRDPERPFILAVGRLEHQKGHDLLLDALARSTAARSLDLVIIGRGSQEATLRARAAALGLADKVSFIGFETNPWAWMAKSKLFVLPSRWEGFPSVAVEALACGVPTLATACDFGPAEVMIHGESGWIVPPGDAGAFASGIDHLLTHPDLMARLAAAGPDRAAVFDLSHMVEAYGHLFIEQAALARTRRRAPAAVLTPEAAPA